jgi:hypothetical protein
VSIARAQGDVDTLCWGLNILVVASELGGGDGDVALAHAREALDFADRTGNALSRGRAHVHLGIARTMRQEWWEATAAIEQGLSIWRQGRVGLEGEPFALAHLAQAQLGAGEQARARANAERAVAMAVDRGTTGYELPARLALARALRAEAGADGAELIGSELTRLLELVERTGARTLEPHVRLELAELARVRGDHAACDRERSEARRLFTEIGAPALAARVPLAVS